MIFFFLFGLLKAQYFLFIDDSFSRRILKEAETRQISVGLAKCEDALASFSYTDHLFSKYYTSFDYLQNIEAKKYSLNLSFYKGFNNSVLRGIFLIDYSYLYYYKKNSFIDLAMQVGKNWGASGFDLGLSYFFSLDELSDRFIISIEPFYAFRKSKISIEGSLYLLSKSDLYEENISALKLKYSFLNNSIDIFLGNIFNKEYNTIVFGFKSACDI